MATRSWSWSPIACAIVLKAETEVGTPSPPLARPACRRRVHLAPARCRQPRGSRRIARPRPRGPVRAVPQRLQPGRDGRVDRSLALPRSRRRPDHADEGGRHRHVPRQGERAFARLHLRRGAGRGIATRRDGPRPRFARRCRRMSSSSSSSRKSAPAPAPCIGAEACIRWNHPSGSVRMPESFMAIAEASNLILDVGDWVIERRGAGARPLAGRRREPADRDQCQRPPARAAGFLRQAPQAALARSASAPWLLELEITEASAMQCSAIGRRRAWPSCAAWAISIAIDDFGSGYSSLARIRAHADRPGQAGPWAGRRNRQLGRGTDDRRRR